MLDPEAARSLLDYDRRVWVRYARSVRNRGWREAVREREIGHHSLKNTLVHILNVREAWLVAVDQGRWEVFDQEGRQPDAISSWAALEQYRTRIDAAISPWIAQLTPARLRERVRAPWMPGKYTVADSFHQLHLEQAHHLGEIIAVYWQNDWKPPEMTWIQLTSQRSSRAARPRRARARRS